MEVRQWDFLTYNSMNSPILFRWWDELPPSGIEKNKVFGRERLFDSPGRGTIITRAVPFALEKLMMEEEV